jgi:hypothetical protein
MSEYNTGGDLGDRGVSMEREIRQLVTILQKVTGSGNREPFPCVIHLKLKYQIRAVLDFSRFEEGCEELYVQPTDLADRDLL